MNGALVPGAVLTPEETLEAWMREYGSAVLRTCFVCLADAHLAQDAAQDTFIKAWRAMDKFRKQSPASEKAWLMRIAVNTCRDYRRGMWFRKVDLPGEIEKLPPPALQVSDGERETFLDVMRLPDKHRQIILLYYYQQMTLREMGEVLGLKPSSVHHRLKKAEAALRRAWEGRGDDE